MTKGLIIADQAIKLLAFQKLLAPIKILRRSVYCLIKALHSVLTDIIDSEVNIEYSLMESRDHNFPIAMPVINS